MMLSISRSGLDVNVIMITSLQAALVLEQVQMLRLFESSEPYTKYRWR